MHVLLFPRGPSSDIWSICRPAIVTRIVQNLLQGVASGFTIVLSATRAGGRHRTPKPHSGCAYRLRGEWNFLGLVAGRRGNRTRTQLYARYQGGILVPSRANYRPSAPLRPGIGLSWRTSRYLVPGPHHQKFLSHNRGL